MAFERPRTSLDFQTCTYGTSRLQFRGPRPAIDGDYIAFIGGSETFGKFCQRPFPDLVGAALGKPALNLGCLNAGLDVFHDDSAVLEHARRAALRVVQVPGAQNVTNRLYAVHPRRNDRFLKASRALQQLYAEVDFTEFHFTGHLLSALYARDPGRFAVVADELRQAWCGRMASFLARVGGPTVILWISKRTPDDAARGWQLEPRLVDRAMLAGLSAPGRIFVEAVIAPTRDSDLAAMHFDDLEASAAAAMPGPAAHGAIAERLVDALPAPWLTQLRKDPPLQPQRDGSKSGLVARV